MAGNLIWSVATWWVVITGIVTVQSQWQCKQTPFAHHGGKECPFKMNEVIRLDAPGGLTSKYCCVPGSEGEKYTKSAATSCEATKCLSATATDLCSSLYQRSVNGKALTFEETLRETCTKVDGEQGIAGLCCVANTTESAMVSVNGAESHEFPHIALLNLGGVRCGGTIYNKRYIITAAHCFVKQQTGEVREPNDKWKVYLGQNLRFVESPGNVYGVEKAIPHEQHSRLKDSPEYKKRLKKNFNDVGLLKLDRDISFGPNVKSLEIAPKGFVPLDYADNTVTAGWGVTDTLHVTDNLQRGNFVIHSDDKCYTFANRGPWIQYEEQADQLLCLGGSLAGKWSPTAGSGDSGGPAVCRGKDGRIVLCGVTSFGGSDTLCAKDQDYCVPSSYAEVSHFHDWIKGHAGEQDSETLYKPYLYGQQVGNKMHEHQVHITSTSGKACGGTLIEPDLVLTAAHCVTMSDGSSKTHSGLKVTFGIRSLNSTGETHEIKNIAVLQDFKMVGKPVNIEAQGKRLILTDNYHKNDLALVKLKKPASISANKLPSLPNFGDHPSTTAYEVAFPRSSTRGGNLMQREFKMLEMSECQTRLDRMRQLGLMIKVDNNLLCGVETYSGGSICDRELGGGLICKGPTGKDILCGVQVFRLCSLSIPNGFINVGLYKGWIDHAKANL